MLSVAIIIHFLLSDVITSVMLIGVIKCCCYAEFYGTVYCFFLPKFKLKIGSLCWMSWLSILCWVLQLWLLCWVSLCWVPLCRVPLCRVLLCSVSWCTHHKDTQHNECNCNAQHKMIVMTFSIMSQFWIRILTGSSCLYYGLIIVSVTIRHFISSTVITFIMLRVFMLIVVAPSTLASPPNFKFKIAHST